MILIKKIVPILIVLALSFWAINPLLSPGFFPIHDNTQVARVFEMTQSLKDGIFPVRWVSDLGYGYGYPIFNFYAPLSYYLGSFIQLVGIDALNATKIMMGIGVLLSGLFMYLLAREFWGKIAGVTAAVFYVYAPFHAADIFVRGDVAEFWAYAFIPLSFFGLYKIYKTKSDFRWVSVAALGFGGTILSHNLTALMVAPFIIGFSLFICWSYFKKKDKRIIYGVITALILGLGLSSFYFLPALQEQKYTNVISQIGGGADYKDHFVCLPQLWQSQWGFGGSVPGCLDGISFMVGKVHLILSAIGVLLIVFYFFIKKEKGRIKILALCAGGFIISVFLMLSSSKLIWDHMPMMAYFQFPWRFLLLTAFFSSLISAGAISLISDILRFKKSEFIFSVLAILLVLYMNIKFFLPQYTYLTTAADFTNESTLKWETSQISDEYMPRDFLKPQNKIDVIKNRVSFNEKEVVLKSSKIKSSLIDLNIEAKKTTKIHFNIAYFPGWRLSVDGVNKGSIVSKGYDVLIPAGSHNLKMEFVQTNTEKTANIISLLSVFVLIIGIIFWNKKLLNE